MVDVMNAAYASSACSAEALQNLESEVAQVVETGITACKDPSNLSDPCCSISLVVCET